MSVSGLRVEQYLPGAISVARREKRKGGVQVVCARDPIGSKTPVSFVKRA
jgi:hypothetical protein